MIFTILFIGLFVLLALLTFFRNVIITLLSSFFSLFRRGKGCKSDSCETTSGRSGRTQSGSTYNTGSNSHAAQGQSGGKKKVFDKSEAEYVDFEEVKH